MDENEFTIKPQSIRRVNRGNGRKPMPPGQTRHVYYGEEDKSCSEEEEFDAALDSGDEGYDENLLEDDDDAKNTRRVKKTRPKKAATTRKNKRTKETDETGTPGIVKLMTDRRMRIWLGIASVFLGVVIIIVLLSFLRSGGLDQAYIMNLTPQQIADAGIKVNSATGPGGAWMGQILFAESFGIGSFVAGIYFIILGGNLLIGRKFQFWSFTFRCALLMIALSIVVGLITYALGSEICWGGTHGHYVNKWLLTMTGIPGALMVSAFLIATLVALYFNQISRFYNNWKDKRNQKREKALQKAEEQKSELTENLEATDSKPDKEDENGEESENESQESREISENYSDSEDVNSEKVGAGPAPSNITVFEIDSDVTSLGDEGKDNGESDKETAEPGFEIDVPVAETGKKYGSVAEKLVAEQGEYDPRAELSRFKFPTLDMLADHPFKATVDTEEQQSNKDRIIKTLGNYGITIESIKATVGPTVTLYEIVPTDGIRIAQIKRLEDDIAMSLAAKGIRIIAPMPGKGTVGIEVPNREPQVVSMRTILASKKFRESKAKLPVALGATISNEIFVADLAAMPHALVAGATGQGKSVGLNVLISSLLYRKHPTELKFVLIDPKMVEFSVYERLRGHYLASLPGEEDAIVTDPSKVLNVLNSLCVEMDNRYALLRNAAVNKIEDYNRKFCQRSLSMEKGHKYLPYIVVIIDEFADLIMTGGKEIEMPVMRITQKARAVGIHMIIATQRPSTNVLTGLIKANCPSRIAFRVLQNVDSRTILDRPGAEHLIGRGDMLYSQGGELERMQCAFISSDEIEAICNSIDAQPGFEEPYPLPEPSPENASQFGGSGTLPAGGLDRDPLFDEAARFVVTSSTASTSSLQRRFEIGYNRAGKIMDQMEAIGIVGPASGSKARSVLVDPVTLERILANR